MVSIFTWSCVFCIECSRTTTNCSSVCTKSICYVCNVTFFAYGALMFVMYVTCYWGNGKYFYVVMHFFAQNATGRQLPAPLFAQNRFVMYRTFSIPLVFVMYLICYLYNLGCQACVLPTESKKNSSKLHDFYHYIHQVYQKQINLYFS